MARLTILFKKIETKIGIRFITSLIAFTVVSMLAGMIWLAVLMKREILPAQASGKDDCASCHAEIHASWHNGAHGDTQSKSALSQGSNCLACHKETPNASMSANNATSSFEDFWVKEGMPNNCLSCHVSGYDKATNTWKSDGIACEVCHGIVPENHPDAVVSVNDAKENCHACHTDDRFDWGKWKGSVHFQNSISCVDCHNPHTTSLKITGETHGAPAQLCENCHEKLAESSEHSIHTKIGVTCTDCHLGEPKGNDDFHQIPDHDFKPKIETCNKCHIGQMHLAGEPLMPSEIQGLSPAKTGAESDTGALTEPRTELLSNPFGFIATSTLFGVIGGAVLRKSVYRKRE